MRRWTRAGLDGGGVGPSRVTPVDLAAQGKHPQGDLPFEFFDNLVVEFVASHDELCDVCASTLNRFREHLEDGKLGSGNAAWLEVKGDRCNDCILSALLTIRFYAPVARHEKSIAL